MTPYAIRKPPANGTTTPVIAAQDALFAGSGDMRARCRAFDWSTTALGPESEWSHSLRTTVALVLASRQPMFLFWGPELVQFYNDAYRPSLGLGGRADTALGARGHESWTDIWATIGPQIAQVMTTGDATWHEDQLLQMERNGQVENVWWTYSYSPVRDDDGTIAGALVVCQETTGRVRAEQAARAASATLAAERAQLRAIVDQAPAYIAVLRGPEHRFEHFNAAYARLVGDRAVVGASVADALPEVVEQGFIALLDHVLATGESHVGRALPVSLTTGLSGVPTVQYLDFVFQPLTEADGTRSGIFVHAVDVTDVLETRRVEEAARAEAQQSAVQLRAFADAIPTLAWTARADGYITWFNARWYEYTGTTPDAMEGWGWQRVHDPEVLPAVLERWTGSITTGQPFEMAFPLRAADGTFRTFLTRIIPTRDASGVVTGWFGTNTDIELEAGLRKAAEDANRAKSEFLAVMSHELRTPLNAIDGYAELMELGIRGPVTDAQRVDLARIRKSQAYLLGLINQVLNYARVEAGVVHYDCEPVSMQAVLTTCEALTLPQAQTHGLTLERLPCDTTLIVRADQEKVQQIVLNLLSNAIKFTDAGGRVTVGCVRGGDTEHPAIHVRVTDTGLGIAESKLARIFEPFVQVDSNLTRTRPGTGLGLAISRDLARGMGGDLTVTSTVGTGSTFTLVLHASIPALVSSQ